MDDKTNTLHLPVLQASLAVLVVLVALEGRVILSLLQNPLGQADLMDQVDLQDLPLPLVPQVREHQADQRVQVGQVVQCHQKNP